MTYSFWVPGPLPCLNDIIAAAKGFGGRGYGYSKLKAEWTQKIAWIIKAAHIPKCERIRCEFEWVSKDKRRDPDGVEAAGAKFVWDSLQLSGVIENDGWSQNAGSTHTHRLVDKPERPGVRVTIVPV